MTPPASFTQPIGATPLALLTLAVLAAHLLLFGQPMLQQAQRPPRISSLVTRVLSIAGPAQPAPLPTDVTPSVPQSKRARAAAGVLPVPQPGLPAPVAPVATTHVSSAASAPASVPPAIEKRGDPVPAMAFTIPGPVRLLYDVTGLSRGQAWNLKGQLLWRHDGSEYEATLEYASPLVPSRSQRSTGRITPEGLAPSRFSDKGRGEQATHFERDSGTLVFSSNAPQLPLVAGAQDRVSVFMQLASMLAADPGRFPPGAGISIVTAGARDAEPWLFTVEGDETLALPGGAALTRKLLRLPKRRYDMRVELWLGIGADYVPLRIRLTQANGDFVDQQWSSTDRP
ncbi:MAG: DUF3108 domain-containing protein [Pseudomonadota bacterium]|nr:DUF3108 domain-containing protein [Pseudomonadota bacterium]